MSAVAIREAYFVPWFSCHLAEIMFPSALKQSGSNMTIRFFIFILMTIFSACLFWLGMIYLSGSDRK